LPTAGANELVRANPSSRYASDVAFVGAGNDPSRADALIALSQHVQVKVWGPGWERWKSQLSWGGRQIEGRTLSRVCSSSKITLGVLPAVARDAMSHASDQMWMTSLAGGFYLGARSAEAETLFADGVH